MKRLCRRANSRTSVSMRTAACSPKPNQPNIVPVPTPDGVGVEIDGVVRRGFPTPSGKLEFYSTTLAAWGWPEYAIPSYAPSHVAPQKLNLARNEYCLVPTFRLPVLIHTRSGNAKWL